MRILEGLLLYIKIRIGIMHVFPNMPYGEKFFMSSWIIFFHISCVIPLLMFSKKACSSDLIASQKSWNVFDRGM